MKLRSSSSLGDLFLRIHQSKWQGLATWRTIACEERGAARMEQGGREVGSAHRALHPLSSQTPGSAEGL
jgi:hypothetical protein